MLVTLGGPDLSLSPGEKQASSDQVSPAGQHGGLDPIADSELGENRLQVRFDGVLAQVNLGRDLPIRIAFDDQSQNGNLRAVKSLFSRTRQPSAQTIHHLAGNLRRE